ncbi:MAG: aminopeptidase [Gammaproteobacteria bacterium]|uniref:aminopeptidase n=1 Tax=Limnobacter sp. TaxID=2003368 RepID=UPI00311D7837|nr:aminopeptidase [Gammaproteobacteria bacterium]
MIRRSMLLGLWLVSAVLLNACSTGSYFWQATTGHLKVLAAAENIDEVLSRSDVSDRLRTQLEYVQDIREFSVGQLGLPDNRSYRTYADLNRAYAVWNVVASQPDSLTLETWCFPLLGCISYKGFYSESNAVALAESLRKQGLDVAVLGVPAYSTLGFTPDPVLNTFVNYPAGELARLVFHELAHQVVYIADDTMFNESFATAIEELGVIAWLAQPGREVLKAQYDLFDSRRNAFRLMLARARDDLEQIYENSHGLDKPQVLRLKEQRFEQLLVDYDALKESWGGWTGYDRFMAEDLNNAKLGVSGLYTQYVPAFKALHKLCGQSFPRFYAATEVLGEFPREQREILLAELQRAEPLSFGFKCL